MNDLKASLTMSGHHISYDEVDQMLMLVHNKNFNNFPRNLTNIIVNKSFVEVSNHLQTMCKHANIKTESNSYDWYRTHLNGDRMPQVLGPATSDPSKSNSSEQYGGEIVLSLHNLGTIGINRRSHYVDDDTIIETATVLILREKEDEIFDRIIAYLRKNIFDSSEYNAKSNTVSIICTDSQGGLQLRKIPNKMQPSGDILEHYNVEMKAFNDHIIAKLSASSKGVALLHGPPGTGKTSYIRHLISKIPKNFIYLPPSMSEALGSPSFLTFLLECKDSIMIIEDAENVLRTREGGGNQAVSNILNASDGLLSDVLQIQLICTFNTDLNEIDSALRRPGRLLGEHKFEFLASDRASALATRIHGKNISYDKPTSLAEVFSHQEEKFVEPAAIKQQFGFL